MKPGKPLERTELKRKTPLVAHTPMPRSSTPLRRAPIAQVSAKRRRDNSKRAVIVSAMREAAAGRCARCGRRDMPVHGHERLARAHGGDIVHPDCLLCPTCNGWAEDAPRVAAWTGWKCSTKWPHDPALEAWQARALDGSIVSFEISTEEAA